MKTLTILSQKGGAGKTTIAVNLAVAASLAGKSVVLIDVDPQASAAKWSDIRESDDPLVISAQAARMDQYLETAQNEDVDLVIVDTAPHSQNDALAAARAADLLLIPCRPSVLDLHAIGDSVNIATLSSTPAYILLNACPPIGNLPKEAEAVIQSYDAQVAPRGLVNRAAFVHSLTAGMGVMEYEPQSKAAEEIDSLHQWITSML